MYFYVLLPARSNPAITRYGSRRVRVRMPDVLEVDVLHLHGVPLAINGERDSLTAVVTLSIGV